MVERLDGEERLLREDPRKSLANEGEATARNRSSTRGTRGIAGGHDGPDLWKEILSEAPRLVDSPGAVSMEPKTDETCGDDQGERGSGECRHQAIAPRPMNRRNRRNKTTAAASETAIDG
jgi:hypothetical protein